jgi:prolyl oligopeptidase
VVEVHALPPGAVELAPVSSTQVFVDSTDGARVPMMVIARADVTPDGARPTILYGYGGFANALTPGYASTVAAWVEAGGVYVIANLRGGSEYGEVWHRAGMRDQKQHTFDDFIACAERLIADGWTSAEHLGISGGSNGGLLVGAALTQRPDLFRSVVCSAPLLDMVRYERFGLGATWNDEYGRADDADELGWLLAYSPYHRVVPGTRYPSVLFTVFDGDSRVDPLHARKLCAALQWATTGDGPVLLRRERDVGHGARSISRTIELSVDTLAFEAERLGLSFPAP